MALLREMVEKKRQMYLQRLTEVGSISTRKTISNFTLSEMEELYRKWNRSRKDKDK